MSAVILVSASASKINSAPFKSESNGPPTAPANQDQSLMINTNSFLDSPATTSATTYQMCMHGGGATQNIFINRSISDSNESDDPRGTSSLVLMEVSV